MPPRYQQDHLQSPVVGTPGIDQSAGVAEQQIAQNDQKMHETQSAFTMQGLRQAEDSFNNARASFFHFAQQYAADQRYNAAVQKATQDEQRKLQAQFDRIDEDGRLDSYVSSLKNQYADKPDQAVKAFQDQLPVMQKDFQNRHMDDPQKLRMLMPSQRQQEHGALSDLQTWARTTTSQNLEKRLALLPAETEEKIKGITGNLDQQVIGFNKAIDGTNQIYANLQKNALTPAVRDEIKLKMINFNNNAGKQFVDHLISQTPDGEDGIKYLDALHGSVKIAQMYGVSLSDDDKNTALQRIQSQRNGLEQQIVADIHGQNDLNIIDANKLKFQLFQAADDPTKMHQIATTVQDRYQDLEKQIGQVSKEPDSKIKNAKLAGLKQQQNALTAELGLDVKMVKSFEQLQRTLTTFAQGQLRFQQSQLTFQQGQLKFQQGQDDRVKKLENEAATNKMAEAKEQFNRNWGQAIVDLKTAFAQPQGLKQQQAVSEVVNKYRPVLNQALTSGTIDANSFKSYLDQLQANTDKAALHRQANPLKIGGFSFGGGAQALKGADKQKALDQATADLGNVLKSHQDDLSALSEAADQIATLTQSKAERAYLKQYVTANMPVLLNSAAYKKLPPPEQAKKRAAAIRAAVQQYRDGTLK